MSEKSAEAKMFSKLTWNSDKRLPHLTARSGLRGGLRGAWHFCIVFAAMTALVRHAHCQALDVPVYEDGAEARHSSLMLDAAAKMRQSGQSIPLEKIREQLRRTSCHLTLPAPSVVSLRASEVWARARQSHVRIGWTYRCTKCDDWHLKLAGGYLLATNGAAATSYHVIEPPRDIRDGNLVAADDDDRLFPVAEVLAADRYSDTCLVRLVGENFKPLALNTNVHPGDTVYCFSDPLGRRGYFSQGIVNRFFASPGRRRGNEPGAPVVAPTWIHVSCDWSQGSSGSAVLDQFGNAIGHVSAISVNNAEKPQDSVSPAEPDHGAIVFRQATSARDVLRLIRDTK